MLFSTTGPCPWVLSGPCSGSSVLGVAVVQGEGTLAAFGCLMFCLLVPLVLCREALVMLVLGGGVRCMLPLSHLPYPSYLVAVHQD